MLRLLTPRVAPSAVASSAGVCLPPAATATASAAIDSLAWRVLSAASAGSRHATRIGSRAPFRRPLFRGALCRRPATATAAAAPAGPTRPAPSRRRTCAVAVPDGRAHVRAAVATGRGQRQLQDCFSFSLRASSLPQQQFPDAEVHRQLARGSAAHSST